MSDISPRRICLERIESETLVVNNPASVRNAPEKVMVLDYRQYMPPTLITRSADEVRDFQREHGAVVIKPLHGNGGKAIFKVEADGSNLGALFEVFNTTWPEPHMVQPFLPEVAKGDKRIVLIDGEVAGAINRRPGEGEFRSNLAVGGSAEATELTARELEICAAMGPRLKELGLIFVGIDVIGGEWLTEINVTSPTGIIAIDRFNGTDTPGMIWDAIEARLKNSGMDDWIIRLVNDTGYWGVGLLMFLETVFPPVPSEVIMTVAGVSAARGNLHFGGVVASWHSGRDARQLSLVLAGDQIRFRPAAPLCRPHGRWLTLSWQEIERGHELFKKHGSIIVLFARMLPTFRSLISIPAGIFRMSHRRFWFFHYWHRRLERGLGRGGLCAGVAVCRDREDIGAAFHGHYRADRGWLYLALDQVEARGCALRYSSSSIAVSTAV